MIIRMFVDKYIICDVEDSNKPVTIVNQVQFHSKKHSKSYKKENKSVGSTSYDLHHGEHLFMHHQKKLYPILMN